MKYKKYFIAPEKDWVVFVHGIGGDSRTFSPQLKAFKPHFNLLFPDLRGHGASNNLPIPDDGKYSLNLIAEDLFSLMDDLGIKKAHFIGGSFGATLIRIMQEIAPERFISVVSAGGVLRLSISIYTVFNFGKLMAPYINNHFLYKIMAYIIMPRKNHAKSRQVFINTAKSINEKEYASWLFILSEVKHNLDKLFCEPFKTPALLIVGDQDHAFVKDSIRFCEKNPETELLVIPSCGHLSNIEKYTEFNSSALNFLLNDSRKN
ncbi:alpha/beta fold hydrolase [Maribellus maritimus]|uniref:alpha/beta fold hydrolase n=1 Tax=Maribellus maritimus TaxID=2870838 RepID=UPI001EEABE25|nr:alpha/beta hydrolase [Maribellus maritimus]MCG6187421.1 alpha/beta hydrolase [Maribellus maritimus]